MNSIKYFTSILSFGLFLTLFVFANGKDQKIQEIKEYLGTVFSENFPGCQVLVAREGKVLIKEAYGLADISTKRKLTGNCSLPVGSLSKQFTAMAVYMLEQENKLNIDDDLSKYFPDATKLKGIKIIHLLTHTSGIIDYFKIEKWRADLAQDLTPRETFDLIINENLEFEPGTQCGYSNSGYHILGLIIEKVTGKPLNEFIREKILIPLKMTHTYFIEDEKEDAGLVKGYEYDSKGKYIEPFKVSKTRFYAGGSLITNTDDLLKWDNALYSNLLLNKKESKKYFLPFVTANGDTLSFASGWERNGSNVKIFGHGGGINGFVCQVYRVPDKKIFVAVLMNSINRKGEESASGIAQKILSKFWDEPENNNKTGFEISPQVVKMYEGKYRLSNDAVKTLKYKNGKLYYVGADEREFELIPLSNTRFKAGKGSTFEFNIGKDGKVDSFKLFTGRGKPVIAYKIDIN